MLNQQAIEKQTLLPSGYLSVHSIFPTIQGEGPFAGSPAVFVRLWGCNLQCPGCDTDYTSRSDVMSPIEIKTKIDSLNLCYNPLIVLTGGEPFRQNIVPLIDLLVQEYHVQIETAGTLFVPGGPWQDDRVTIVCSPKAGKINKELEPFIAAYKYIIDASHIHAIDGLPSTTMLNQRSGVARPRPGSSVYVQPLDEKDEAKNLQNRNAAILSCMTFGYTLCLQLHKIIGVE